MKKFLSMVMAAAMVVSLVPATAFAASGDVKATAKVVDAKNYTEKEIDTAKGKVTGPEAQLTFTTADLTSAGSELTFTFTLDNAKITKADNGTVKEIAASVKADDESGVTVKTKYVDEDEFDVTIDKTESKKLTRGDVLKVSINGVTMEKYSKGKEATISVDSDDVTVTNGDDLVFASVESKGIKASVKDTVDVATEEVAELKEVKLEPSVGEKFGSVLSAGDQIKLKLNSGFEFSESDVKLINMDGNEMTVLSINDADSDEDEIVIDVTGNMNTDVIKIQNLKVEATSAKAGATATLKVYATGCDTVSVEVAKVVDYTVSMTVDEDEDVPVIYSGVDVNNTGITDDSDHDALEVTIKESFAGAWNNSKDFTLSLPEGVYVADEISTSTDGDFKLTTSGKTTEQWFQDAYDEGDYIDLTFKRRTWEETNPNDTNKDDPAEISFTLKLVADPNFEGDVVLKLTGDAVEEQEVTIAKFVKPYVVEAQQNDMQIDYRNTEIPTSVVIKEAEAGLWDKNTEFRLALDKIEFDDEGKIAVDDKSGLEIKDNEIKEKDGVLYFTVDSRSDDEPAVVTLSGMQLYMDRSLPARCL